MTHLIEAGFPERFVTDQVGHAYAATTAIYTGVSDDYKNRVLAEALGERSGWRVMTRKMGVRWHLREVMATRGMFSTTDLIAAAGRARCRALPRAGLPAGDPAARAAERVYAGCAV